MRSCIILFMYNLRIIYQLNNSISSIQIILLWCVSLPGFEVLSSKLRKLEVFDLSENPFNDDKNILSFFNGLSALKSLDLSANQLTGSGSLTKEGREKHFIHLVINDSISSCLTHLCFNGLPLSSLWIYQTIEDFISI
jgi:Leucine-rich repeat (LRR) protein